MVGTDFDRLADYVINRRVQFGLERPDVARRMRMDPKTVERIENGKSVRRGTLAALERALDWTPGSARRVLEGGEPETATKASDLTEDEAELIAMLIRHGYPEAERRRALEQHRDVTRSQRDSSGLGQVGER